MERFLNAFRDVNKGENPRNVLTVEWVNAVQDAIRALCEGENISVEGDATRNRGHGKVRIGTRRKFAVLGVARSSCESFRLFSKINEGKKTPNLFVGKGTVGEDYYDTDTDLGSLDEASDNNVYIKIIMDGTDGTYTDEIVVDSGVVSDATTTYFQIGSVSADGVITQSACGPFYVTVCRNWFASEAPYYGITVTA